MRGHKELQEKFEANLNYYMAINGVSVKDLSDGIEVPYATVLGWLHHGKVPGSERRHRIATFFGIATEDLLMKRDIEMPERTRAEMTYFKILSRVSSDEEFRAFLEDAVLLNQEKTKVLHQILKSIEEL